MNTTTTAHAEFYDHKRAIHRGMYESTCPECQQKWEALLAASKAKATARG